MWSAGLHFFYGIFLRHHFRHGIVHCLHDGVKLCTVIHIGNDVQNAAFPVLMLGGCVQDAELFGDFLKLLIVCGLDRDDNGLGVPVLHQPFNADLANHLIVLLYHRGQQCRYVHKTFCGKLRCDLGGFQPLLDHQIGHFAAYFHRSCLLC